MSQLTNEKRILVTGAAGFIGAHLVRRLLADGCEVVGVDNLNNYYDARLKNVRLRKLCMGPKFWFIPLDLADKARVESLFRNGDFEAVIHLAAQPGVRRSIAGADEYVASNLVAFVNVLEGIRNCRCGHFLFASSSSVYGARKAIPFTEEDSTDYPVSLYAATKKSNEVLAHAYSQMFGIPTTGLRFFTVYGPWGRPDMAIFKFVDAIANDRVVELYNCGRLRRDFTFVEDVVEAATRILPLPPGVATGRDVSLHAPMRLCNVGCQHSVEVLELVQVIEECLGRKAQVRLVPMQLGDVFETEASAERLQDVTGFTPSVSLEVGVRKFVDWYRNEYVPLGLGGSSGVPRPATRAGYEGAASVGRCG